MTSELMVNADSVGNGGGGDGMMGTRANGASAVEGAARGPFPTSCERLFPPQSV